MWFIFITAYLFKTCPAYVLASRLLRGQAFPS